MRAFLTGLTLLIFTARADEIPFDIFTNNYLGIGFRAPVVPDVLSRLRLSEKYESELLRREQIIFDLRLNLTNYRADKMDALALADQFRAEATVQKRVGEAKAATGLFIGLGAGAGAGAGLTLILDGLIRSEPAVSILGGVLLLAGGTVVVIVSLPDPLKKIPK